LYTAKVSFAPVSSALLRAESELRIGVAGPFTLQLVLHDPVVQFLPLRMLLPVQAEDKRLARVMIEINSDLEFSESPCLISTGILSV